MNKYRIVYLEFTTMRKTVTVDAEDWMTARDLAFIVDDDESEDVTKGDQYEVVEITTLGPAKMNDDDLWSMINEINSDMDEGRLTKEEGVPRLRNICKEYLKDTETEKRHALQDVNVRLQSRREAIREAIKWIDAFELGFELSGVKDGIY